MAEIHITKMAAARRQLHAAIRMFFAGEDELAVHTVASAAYRLITDLGRRRGRDEVGEVYKAAMFYVVRDYRRGTLPSRLADDAELMDRVREWAEALPIDENTEYEDLTVLASPGLVEDFWRSRNKVFNFLKHADRDATRHMSMDEVDNFHLLMMALTAYVDVGGDVAAEGYVLWLYSHLHDGAAEGLPEDLPDGAGRLPNDQQREYFSECLAALKRERGED